MPLSPPPFPTSPGHRRVEGDAFNPDKCKYLVDTGDVIEHNYDDGAIVLANKLLATIKDTDDKPDKKRIKSRNKNILKSLTND